MRVTQRTMYNSFINNMQSSLAAYMDSNIQGSSQKKINRPSDDPAGMALVLNTRRNIDNTAQLQRNVDTAQGWLNLADTTLTQTSETIIKIKALAEQAATGTYSDENRYQISLQIRELFGQLLNLSNTQFEGKSLFAGHKYDQPAFQQALAVNTMDTTTVQADGSVGLQNVPFTMAGASERSIMLVFNTTGRVNSDAAQADALDYQWSDDGGKSWQNGTLAAGQNAISMNGATLTIPNGTNVTAQDPTQDVGAQNGTMLYIRPTAVYMGDLQGPEPYGVLTGGQPGLTTNVQGSFPGNVLVAVNNNPNLVTGAGTSVNYSYSLDNGATWVNTTATVPSPANGKVTLNIPGGSVELNASDPANPSVPAGTLIDVQPRRADVMGGPTGMAVNVQGTYNKNVLVRMDGSVDLATGGPLAYSYSTDNGTTWVKANAHTPTPPNGSIRLPLPGGFMDLQRGADPNLTAGTQIVIHPDRADLNYEIMKDTYVSVNSVGKNIFGGIYQGQPGLPEGQNLFEIVGKLIAYTENNNQTGIQECLAAITSAQEKVLTEAARIGGLENRLSLAKEVLSFDKLDQESRLSYTEDVDLTELLTRMAQQQLAYNTVLKSSSMIMQLSLTKFV